MAAKKTVSDDALTYKDLREQLDEVLLKLQDPDCDVDEAVSMYERALVLVSKLEEHLEKAENRIQKVQADFGIGA